MNIQKYYFLYTLLLLPALLPAQIEIVQQSGHKSGITALAVSPDGHYLAASEYYNPRAFLWDIYTRKKVLDFSTFGDLTDLAFSPDGQWIYGLTVYNRVFRYRLSGQQDTTYHYEANKPSWVVHNKHARLDWGDQLIAFSKDLSVHTGNQEMRGMSFTRKEEVLIVEDIAGSQITLTNPDTLYNQSPYMSLDLFAGDRLLAAFRTNGLLEVWDVQEEQLQAVHPFPSVNPFGVEMQLAVNEKESLVYLGCTGWDNIYTFNYSAEVLDSLTINDAKASSFCFNEPAQQLIIGTPSSQILVWDAQKQEVTRTHQLPSNQRIADILALPGKEGEYYVTSGAEIFTYSSSYNLSLPFTRQLKLESPFDVDISADGRLIMAYDTLVNILRLASGRTTYTLPHSDFIYLNRLSPDEEALFVATQKQLFKYSWPSLQRLWAIDHPLGRPRRIFFSPDSKLINLVAKNRAIQYLSEDGTPFIEIPGDQVAAEHHPFWIIGGTIDNQGNMIAVSPTSNDGVLQYWMKDLHKPLNALRYDSHGPVRIYAASSDQQHVTFAYPEGWKAYTVDLSKSGSSLQELEGNTVAAQYSHSNKLLATGSIDGKFRVFDVATLSQLLEFEAGNARVYNLIFSRDDRYLFANMQDGYLLMYDLQEGRPVGQILLHYEHALIITDDAYYMGAKDLLQSLGFKKSGQTFSFSQFDAQLNRPGKVINRLGFGSPELIESYALIEQKRSDFLGTSEDYLQQSEAIPMVLVKNRSTIPLVTKAPQLALQLTAEKPLETTHQLHLWVNGVPVYGSNGKPIQEEDTPIEVELNSHQNQIELALEKEGVLGARTELQVWCERENKPEAYIVSIGVSDYQAAGKDLQFAAKDARDIAGLYRNARGFERIHTKTLTDQQVTKANILALRQWLESTTVDDQVILYVSGHGLLDDKYDFYYATHDIDFADPSEKGILYDEIEGLLDGIPARKKLLLMDACHSGEYDKDAPPLSPAQQDSLKQKGISFKGFAKGDEEGAPVLGLQNSFELMQQLFADLRRGSGATVITSSSGVQVSYEDEDWANGAFTYAFLYGLKTMKADANEDGQVSASEIQAFVAEYVPRLTEGLQVPTFRRENLEFDFRVW